MSIKKMLPAAVMALAAIAFAVPAMAQAQTHGLTSPENTFIVATPQNPVTIKATSEDLVTTTGSGNLECEKVTLYLLVTENTDEHVVISPDPEHAEAETEECVTSETAFGTLATEITDGTVEKATFNTWGTAEAGASFEADISGIGTCGLSGSVHMQATNGTDLIHVTTPTELTKFTGGFLCPSSGDMHGTFTMETPDGTAVVADIAET